MNSSATFTTEEFSSPTSSQKVDLSIIIVNWNTRAVLEPCLRALYAHPPRKYTFEVIVVDNASSDGTAQWLPQAFPQVRLLANIRNYGFARAVNQAYRLSRGRYVASVNPDVETSEGLWDGIISFLDQNPTVGLLAPGLVETRLGAGIHVLVRNDPFRKVPFVLLSKLFPISHSTPSEKLPEDRDFITGNYIEGPCMVARREALDRNQMFNEDTFLYNEEFPLCEAIRRKGYQVGILRRIYIRHIGSSSYRKSYRHTYAARLEALRGWYKLNKTLKSPIFFKIHALGHFIDAGLVFIVIWVMYFILGRKSDERASALGYHRSRLVGFFWILCWPPMLEKLAKKEVVGTLGGHFS